MKLKRFLCLILCLAMLVPFAFLAGCGGNAEEQKRMTMEVNPSLEFMLDKDNKVVSVTALNEDGAVILSGQVEAFVGKSAEDAGKLFVEIATETGYIVKGSVEANTNNLKISISGDNKNAQNLYNSVKESAKKFLDDNNITINIDKTAAKTKEEIAKLVKSAGSSLDIDELKNKSEQDLLKLLAEARVDAQEYIGPALQEMYYKAKQSALEIAESEYVKDLLANSTNILEQAAASALSMLTTYSQAFESAMAQMREKLLASDGEYQKALNAVLAKKQEVLKLKNQIANTLDEDTKAKLEAELANINIDTLVDSLNSVYNSAIAAIDLASQNFATGIKALKDSVSLFAQKFKDKAGEIAAYVKTKATDFANKFDTDYKTQIEDYLNKIANIKVELKLQISTAE